MTDIDTENTRLTSINYNVWAISMQGKLMMANAWRITTGESEKPKDAAELAKWILKREEAAGIILGSLTHTQYVHVEGFMDDPTAMWKRLRSVHRSQIANSRYHAMQRLLNTRKDDAESLTEYIARINAATDDLIALVPSSLTVSDFIHEIGFHAAISGLDQAEYGAFISLTHLLLPRIPDYLHVT